MSKSILIDTFDAIIGKLLRAGRPSVPTVRPEGVSDALLRAPIDGVIEEACLVAADMIERGEHHREGDE